MGNNTPISERPPERWTVFGGRVVAENGDTMSAATAIAGLSKKAVELDRQLQATVATLERITAVVASGGEEAKNYLDLAQTWAQEALDEIRGQ